MKNIFLLLFFCYYLLGPIFVFALPGGNAQGIGSPGTVENVVCQCFQNSNKSNITEYTREIQFGEKQADTCLRQQNTLGTTWTCIPKPPEKINTTKLPDDFKLQAPTLKVNIPGFLGFSTPTTEVDDTGRAYFPWIGEYIRAVYNFSLVAISILAVLMIIVSGIKVVMSGLGSDRKEAYKHISQAVIGLMIAWGSYTILYMINPNLLNLKSLGVKLIVPIELQTLNEPTDLALTKGMACFYENFGKSDAEVQKNLKTITIKNKGVTINKALEGDLNKIIPIINNSPYKITALGGQNWRANINDPSKRSLHSWGIAVDINSDQKINENYRETKSRDGTCYITDTEIKYTKTEDDCKKQGGKTWFQCQTNIPLNIIQAFKNNGFIWGGNFKTVCDSMHFEWHGTCGKGAIGTETPNFQGGCCKTSMVDPGHHVDFESLCSPKFSFTLGSCTE